MTMCQRLIVDLLIIIFGGIFLSSIVLAESDIDGKKIYERRCKSCHEADGSGNDKMAKRLKVSISPLTKATLEEKDDAEILRVIAEGKGKMPKFAEKLSEAEQKSVLNYIKTLGQ